MNRRQACCLTILFSALMPVLAQDAPMRLSSGVTAGLLQTKVAPVYPPDAKAAKIEGTVVMRAIIGKTGLVENLTVINGPEALRNSALDAVRQWTYKPFLLNGNPTEVETTITVNYHLNVAAPQPATEDRPSGAISGQVTTGAPQSPPNRIRVSAAVMNGLIKTKTPPVYPEDAKAAHVTGAVILSAVIDKQGKVTELNAISGPELLRQAAIDAVSQWTYKPYLLNGQPVEVATTITVNFMLTD